MKLPLEEGKVRSNKATIIKDTSVPIEVFDHTVYEGRKMIWSKASIHKNGKEIICKKYSGQLGDSH